MKSSNFLTKSSRIIPFIVLLIIWHVLTVNTPRREFLFGSPYKVAVEFWNQLYSGMLIKDTMLTAIEALLGFLAGNIVGTFMGLGMWYSRWIAYISRPYIVAIGSIPIFSMAPMLIIWFGTGFFAKVVMAVFSTFIVSLVQAYEGALNVDQDQIRLLHSFGASRNQIFRKLIIPSSVVWVIASYKVNIGFAILGAFIGEYISSSAGLGHLIIRAGGLYNIPLVLVGIIMIMLISLTFSYILGFLERKLLAWKYIR